DSSHGPGRFFGELEVIDGRSRTCNARVAADVSLIEIEKAELLDLLYKHPEHSLVLGKGSFQRLRELFSEESLDADLARLREELELSIRQAVVCGRSLSSPSAKLLSRMSHAWSKAITAWRPLLCRSS
ncbi:MAG: hypothetical protein RLZZ516_2789, partial [Cyanobacteriota bacterium]